MRKISAGGQNLAQFITSSISAQLKKRSKSKQADQQNKKDKAIKDAHQEYLNIAQKYLDKALPQ